MKKMKWIALLAIVLAAVLPCAALAARGDANLARHEEMREKYDDGVYGSCVAGDTLYLYGGQHFYTYHIGDADLTAVEYQLPEPEEGESFGIRRIFSDGEKLYALCVTEVYSENYYVSGAGIYPVEVGKDEVTFGEPVELDISDLTVSYGDEAEYFIQVNNVCYVGGYLMMYVYDESGEEAIYALDAETGEGGFVEDVEHVRNITAYADDQLLIQSYNYEDSAYELSLYDPRTESITPACDPVSGEGISIGSMVYSRESDRLFFLSGGYVMAAKDFDFENAEQVAELSSLYYSEDGGMLLPGDYFVYASYDGVIIRATDPGALPETRITVRGGGYSDSIMAAYYSFGNAHGDAAVVLDQTYTRPSEIIEAMMSRDPSVDIYMMSVTSEAYDALYNRGYMVEMDNEEIVSAVEEMYPAIREVLTRDGEIVAIPLNIYGWTLGLDYEGFEKLGIPREDVPDNWLELLDLLEELPELLPEDGSVRIFEDYYTQRSVRDGLIGSIMESWRIHQTAMGRDMGYDSPELIELFEKVMALDYEALGLPEDDEEENGSYQVIEYGGSSDRRYTLIETGVGCTIGNFYSNCEPALLSVIPGEPGEVPLSVSVAFVNPFSQNVDLAQEFLLELMRNMTRSTAYNVSDKLNEPVRYANTLERLEEFQDMLDELRGELETADPVDVPDIEEQIADMERVLEDMDRYGWEIPQRDIDWYRAHAEYLTVERYDFLNAADDDGELSDLSERFMAGKVSAADFLKEVERKVRMRALEGN